jgi:hypothetical protein
MVERGDRVTVYHIAHTAQKKRITLRRSNLTGIQDVPGS